MPSGILSDASFPSISILFLGELVSFPSLSGWSLFSTPGFSSSLSLYAHPQGPLYMLALREIPVQHAGGDPLPSSGPLPRTVRAGSGFGSNGPPTFDK